MLKNWNNFDNYLLDDSGMYCQYHQQVVHNPLSTGPLESTNNHIEPSELAVDEIQPGKM